jgi:predicted phage tail component-like protein
MFTYKGISSEGKMRVVKVTRSVLPPSQLKMLEIDGKAGAYFISKKHGVKKIDLEVVILGDYVNKKRDIADWLDAMKPEALNISDEPNMTDFAILDGETDFDEILDNGFGTITFICPDPYSYGDERSVTLFAGNDSIFNGGTAPSFPTITFNISSSTTSVKIETTDGDYFEVKDDFVIGDVLVIDMEKGKVTRNGTLIMTKVTLESDFFSLKAGTTDFIGTTAQGSARFFERFK